MFRSVVGLEIKAAAVSWMPWRRISSAMTDVPTFARGDFLPSPLDPSPLGDGAVCVFSMTYEGNNILDKSRQTPYSQVMESPKTLQAAIRYFSDEDNCVAYMKAMRWPDGVVVCPTCGRNDVSWLANQRKWQCRSKHTKRQFSAKVGTIFEDSPLGLDKWLMATWMLTNCKNGISSYEVARDLGITQKSAWFMLHRIRVAMGDDDGGKLGGNGPVECDETFVGGKVKNMHKSKRIKGLNYSAGNGKTICDGNA